MNSRTSALGLLAGIAITTLASGKGVPNHAAADLVLGQANFTSAIVPTNSNTPTSMNHPAAVVVDPVTRKVFVADSISHRILRYRSADSLANGAAAEAVFGQTDFLSSSSLNPPTNASLKSPTGLFFDRNGRLWVADSGNNRVLRFSSASSVGSTAMADKVLGQPGFNSGTPGMALGIVGPPLTRMNFPIGLWVDGTDHLWVADNGNHRVLRYDNATTHLDGGAADGVLGQTNFLGSSRRAGPTGLQDPHGVAVSANGSLFVACTGGNRVMRFDNAATLLDGAAATGALGQSDLTSTAGGTSASQMRLPFGLTISSGDTLWVTEGDNNRVIRFNKVTTKATGAAADGFIGQASFSNSAPALTSKGLKTPAYNPFVDATGSLWVPDLANHRVLRFPVDATVPTLALKGKAPKSVKKSLTLKGTASDTSGISRVQFRIGTGPLRTAVGTQNWNLKATLKKGKNTITLFATDTVGNVSARKVLKITRK
jgi:sugar lactone lactonase YvrE